MSQLLIAHIQYILLACKIYISFPKSEDFSVLPPWTYWKFWKTWALAYLIFVMPNSYFLRWLILHTLRRFLYRLLLYLYILFSLFELPSILLILFPFLFVFILSFGRVSHLSKLLTLFNVINLTIVVALNLKTTVFLTQIFYLFLPAVNRTVFLCCLIIVWLLLIRRLITVFELTIFWFRILLFLMICDLFIPLSIFLNQWFYFAFRLSITFIFSLLTITVLSVILLSYCSQCCSF